MKPINRLRFKVERKLNRGHNVKAISDQPSILFYTVHKSASSLVVNLIRELSSKSDYKHVDLDSYVTVLMDYNFRIFEDIEFQRRIYKPKGFYYGALRFFCEVPNIDDYKIFLMLRDPRDVITSLYFSIAYSHDIVNDHILKRREYLKSQTIDEFVINFIPVYKQRYNEYIDKLLKRKNTLFLKYEEMIEDFPLWLDKMSKWLGIFNEEIIRKFTSEINFDSKKEDKHSHVRNILPGDHKRKLKTSTIDLLNKEFRDILIKLDYSV